MGDIQGDLSAINERIRFLLRLAVDQAKLSRRPEDVARYERRLETLNQEPS